MTNTYPQYLFSRKQRALARIIKLAHTAPSLMLFLDYDGTLTPIRSIPSKAVLSQEMKQLLAQLSNLPSVQVAIITGRSMQNIRRLIPFNNINFAANHGLNIRYSDGSEWVHMNAVSSIQMLTEVRKKLHRALKSMSKVFVEDKDLSLSIHYRNASSTIVPSLKNIVTNIVYSTDPTLRITRGKKVLEVRPPTDWGKSMAVLEMLSASRLSQRQTSIFIGDDTTDEDAFRLFRSSGIAIRVGKSTKTKAKYYVKNVNEVYQFLRLIQALRSPESSQQVR